MKTIKLACSFILLFLVVLYFSNCTHMYYVPNGQNIPMLRKQGDIQLGANVFVAAESEGYNFHGAYAATDKWAINLNAIYGYGDYSDENGNGFFTEAGAGYFKELSDLFVFETYADIGLGNVKNSYGNGLGSSDMGFTRHSIQPSISLATKYFDAAISLRTAGLYYYRIGAYSITNQHEWDHVEYIRKNPFSIMLEPAITLRGGVDPVKFQMQYILSFNLNNPDMNYEPFIWNFGFEFNLSGLAQKIKN